MALGGTRQVFETRIDFAMNQVAERGGIVVASTTVGEVLYTPTPTGSAVYPLGMLLIDVEDLNFDRHGEYLSRDVVDVGSVVSLVNRGPMVTNFVVGTPSQGQLAYLHPSGYVGATQLTDGINPAPLVGRFLRAKDANGFAMVYVDL